MARFARRMRNLAAGNGSSARSCEICSTNTHGTATPHPGGAEDLTDCSLHTDVFGTASRGVCLKHRSTYTFRTDDGQSEMAVRPVCVRCKDARNRDEVLRKKIEALLVEDGSVRPLLRSPSTLSLRLYRVHRGMVKKIMEHRRDHSW